MKPEVSELGSGVAALWVAPRAERTLAAALADHGMIYTFEPLPCGSRRVALHSAKGMIGYFNAFEAWELIAKLEDGEFGR